MSVVIVGGNECMTRQYKELCREYKCKAKIYPKMTGGMKDIGTQAIKIVRSHTSSMNVVSCCQNAKKLSLMPYPMCGC